MTPTTPHRSNRKGYGLFFLAAAIYTTGVIAFSALSYFQQSSHLHAQLDQELLNATYATEQILGNIFIECAVETETAYELGYTANKEKLNQFSADCRYDSIGAIGYKGTKTWPLIIAGESQKKIQPQQTIHPKISACVQRLLRSKSEHIQIKTIEIKEFGELRLAIRYQATSANSGYALLVARSTQTVHQLLDSLITRIVINGLFLHVMAFPLILLYNRTQIKTAQKMAKLNTQLQQDAIKQKIRETELKDAIHDLERFNAVATGREHRIMELKAEVNTLLEQMKRKNRYNTNSAE